MTTTDDDLEAPLAGVDLHAWQVPPPAALDRDTLVRRALAPATAPPRARGRWLIGGFALANLALAAVVILVVVRPPRKVTREVLAPAGGGIDPRTDQVIAKLAAQQRDLERELAIVTELRATIEQLAERVARCEARTVPAPAPTPRPAPAPAPAREPPVAPMEDINPDEIFGSHPANPALPDAVGRAELSAAIARVRPALQACARTAHVTEVSLDVSLKISTAGRVVHFALPHNDEPGLYACVERVLDALRFTPAKAPTNLGFNVAI